MEDQQQQRAATDGQPAPPSDELDSQREEKTTEQTNGNGERRGENGEKEEEWEPRKRITGLRIEQQEGEGKVEEEKKEEKRMGIKEEDEAGKEEEGGDGGGAKQGEDRAEQQQRKNCVKDENGFTYYKCRFCGLTFNFMTTLKAHERVHDIVQPYTCNKCGESFHFMCELEYHAKTHIDQKGYKCECGRTFFQYTDLLYHHHPGEEPAPAAVPLPPSLSAPPPPPLLPSSSSALPTAPSLADFPTPEFAELGFEPKHQMRVWSDIRSKPYICQYCSKSYADSRGLAYHMYSHRGERIFNPRASRYLMCRNDNSYISSGVDLRDA